MGNLCFSVAAVETPSPPVIQVGIDSSYCLFPNRPSAPPMGPRGTLFEQ